MIPINIVVAIDDNRGIGKDGNLPWELPGDLKHFREITSKARSPKKKNIVVMGRKTWDSIPAEFRPLPNRTNVVLTRNKCLQLPEGVLKAESFDKVLEMSHNEQLAIIIETIFIIGGQQIYGEALKHPECTKLYVTRVHGVFDCDTMFPPFNDEFESMFAHEARKEGAMTFHFEEYNRKNISKV